FLLAGIDDGDGAITDGAVMRRELVLDFGIDLLVVVASGFTRGRTALGGSSGADARRFRSSEESRDLVERTLGGGQPDSLRGTLAAFLEAFERDGQVRPAF